MGTGRPKSASFARKSAGPPRKPDDTPRPKSRAKSARPKRSREDGSQDDADRLQKVLAHAGVDSRRACEDLILQGRITVDGKIVRELGTRVDPETARIEFDGQRIKIEKHVYYAVNKPKGYVSTNDDPSGRPRVVDMLPEIPQRVYTVGRLDEDSTGLILLTNDGELANKLAHPRFGVEKLYRILVAGLPSPEVLQRVTDGVWLADGKVRAKRVKIIGRQGEATNLELVLAEGKNREVRRIFAKMGHKVMSLTRVAVGPILLKGLAIGEHRILSKDEVELLRKTAAGLDVSPSRAKSKDRRPAPKDKSVGGPKREQTEAAPKLGPEVVDEESTDSPEIEAGTPEIQAGTSEGQTGSPDVQGPSPAKTPIPGLRLTFKLGPRPAGDNAPARPSSPVLGPKVTGPAKPAQIPGGLKPNTVLSSGAVVGARPGTGNRPAQSSQRPQGGSSDDRRQHSDSRDRRPSGPSTGSRPPSHSAGRPSGPSVGRPAGSSGGRPSGPSSGGRPSGPSSGGRPSGPSVGRPAGSSGGRPSAGRPSGPHSGSSGPKILGPKLDEMPTGRKIIGLDPSAMPAPERKGRPETGQGASSGPKPSENSKQKRPPRAAHGVKRKPRDKDRG